MFSFGLLHGMGFAGVLRDLGLPRSQFLTALLTFNGVEAGQLTVIALSFLAVAQIWRANLALSVPQSGVLSGSPLPGSDGSTSC